MKLSPSKLEQAERIIRKLRQAQNNPSIDNGARIRRVKVFATPTWELQSRTRQNLHDAMSLCWD